jgi:poly(beta-D-mannuronate) lyase
MKLSILMVLLLPWAAAAADRPVADAAALEQALKDAKPGDILLLAEGEWRDVVIRCLAEGTEQAPITLRAATPGKTVFTGASGLRLGGRHVVVDGLWFRNPDPSVGDTIEFRLDSKHLAEHCRITQCAITLDPGQAARDAKESRWLGLYGGHNRVDHCYLAGKVTKGATAVVWLGEGQVARHRIDHNHSVSATARPP